MPVNKIDLLKQAFGIEEVELQRGGTVSVRGLTRSEALKVKGQEMPEAEMEQHLLSTALVDPKLTRAEVAEWQDASPAGEIEDVIAAIMRLSGMEKSAPKEAYKSV